MSVLIKINNTTIQVYLVYCPPPVNIKELATDIQAMLKGNKGDTPTIICGDFNVDLLKCNKNNQLLQEMTKYGFTQIVKAATTDYTSLLDHIYVNKGINATATVSDCYYSDHDIIQVNLQV